LTHFGCKGRSPTLRIFSVSEHFTSTGGVLVHQEDDAAMKAAVAKTFSDHEDGRILKVQPASGSELRQLNAA
jgi:hypothetical protein